MQSLVDAYVEANPDKVYQMHPMQLETITTSLAPSRVSSLTVSAPSCEARDKEELKELEGNKRERERMRAGYSRVIMGVCAP